MDRPAIIDMNPVDLKYYPFMISLNTCTGSCNILSPKICVPKETKDINVKAFNIKKKNVMAVVMSYLQKYVFLKKQKT